MIPNSNSFHQRGPGAFTREEVLSGEIRNRTQEDKILALMRLRPEENFTAEDVVSFFPEIFITDARRAMTNLSDKGLVRFVEKVPGSKGVRIMAFRIISSDRSHNQLALF